MSNRTLLSGPEIDVAIIGGGPSGLAAATELKRRGVGRVVVLEREPEAGGIPRHCGHPPFGMREFKRVLSGPKYARRLVKRALKANVEIHTGVTVVRVHPGPRLELTMPKGAFEILPNRVIYATGVREKPRSARLVSGVRKTGILNTGALQSMVYLKGLRPFEHPVIVGTELVSFSAIQTCRHAGIKPVAMIEEGNRTTARWPTGLYPGLRGVPLELNTRLVRINGTERVSGITVSRSDGTERDIDCDGVLFTGCFTPESTLARMGHLQLDADSNGPVVDQFYRCSDPRYFATGNVLRPVETAGWSWSEGCKAGVHVADDIEGKLGAPDRQITVLSHDPMIKLVVPQRISMPMGGGGMEYLQVRFSRSGKGFLQIFSDGVLAWDKPLTALPERRILVPLAGLVEPYTNVLELRFQPAP